MPRFNLQSRLASLEEQKQLYIHLRRRFRKELRYLRNLPTPEFSATNYWDSYLILTYKAKFLDMRQAEKYLTRFGAVAGLEDITSEDQTDGTRSFRCTYIHPVKEKNGHLCHLQLRLHATPVDDDLPEAKCRKVQIGTETHTHTFTTPIYKIVCDE